MVSTVETNPDDFDDFEGLHALLTDAYAPMTGRIDPPSFLTRMSVADVAMKARDEDLFLLRDAGRPVACMFGHGDGRAYEVGKVAVAASHRCQGLARSMMEVAARLGQQRGCRVLRLFARVELTENHVTYRRLGFEITGPFTHPGFHRPTAYILERTLQHPFPRPGRLVKTTGKGD